MAEEAGADKSAQNKTFVKLISAEGHEFFVDRQTAVSTSKTIQLMLEGNFREAQDNVIRFPDIASYVLERVVHYLNYKVSLIRALAYAIVFMLLPHIMYRHSTATPMRESQSLLLSQKSP